MRNDFFLFVGILAFIFILWLYTGGPSRPISFAGPYLSPNTSTGDTDTYWPSFGADTSAWGNWGGSDGWGGTGNVNEIPEEERSEYGASVSLSGGNVSATDIDEEYLTLRANSDEPVAISGWTLRSDRTGASVRIPSGVQVARSGSTGTIFLERGMTARIVTGSSPLGYSFAETKCTGYLNSRDEFSPQLDNRCPAPESELGRFYSGNANRYDQCAEYVRSLQTCEDPRSSSRSIPGSCQEFVDARLSYQGCVAAHRADEDFLGNTWRIYLGQRQQLWRSDNDTIYLLDSAGKVVDVYAY